MAQQPKNAKGQNVRFITKNGRKIPIAVGPGGGPASGGGGSRPTTLGAQRRKKARSSGGKLNLRKLAHRSESFRLAKKSQKHRKASALWAVAGSAGIIESFAAKSKIGKGIGAGIGLLGGIQTLRHHSKSKSTAKQAVGHAIAEHKAGPLVTGGKRKRKNTSKKRSAAKTKQQQQVFQGIAAAKFKTKDL